MKIRSDFVTNSSSSSFIIRPSSQYKTKEDIYQLIRRSYQELRDIIHRAEEDLGCKISDIDFKTKYKMEEGFENKYGISIYDTYLRESDIEWMKCSSYEEFEQYQKEKNAGEDRFYRTYEIVDLSTSESECCEEVKSWYEYNDSRLFIDTFKFGSLCVYRGEDGGFPEYVKNKLIEECDLWCGYMG